MQKTLANVPPAKFMEAEQAGVLRVHLYLIGKTHEQMLALAKDFRRILTKHAASDGKLDSLGYLLAQQEMLPVWQAFYREWAQLFYDLRYQAGTLAYGGLAVTHERQSTVLPQTAKNESRRRMQLTEATAPDYDGVFKPQLAAVLDAADRRLYGDGLTLSQRIWKLDADSWRGIQATLANGIARGDSAWNIAALLETYLGAGAECPRWAEERLYTLTKKDIARGDRTGLFSGAACAGQGVAYNALRLARNEIQVAHQMANDSVFAKLPWIEQEAINLSPSHPPINCKCEKVVKEGVNGTNVYPKGAITLPLHVQCLCYKTAVLMGDDPFVAKVRGWLDGTQPWGAMDDYASWLGVLPQNLFTISLAVGIANNLVTWLWGDEDDIAAAIGDQTVQLPFSE